MNFKNTTIKQLHNDLLAGTITAKDLHEHSVQIINERNESLRAFIEVFPHTSFDIDVSAGVLAGIPVAIKDNMLFKGKKATAASKILENYVATYDSKIAQIFNKQNALVMGRVNMDDSAMGSSTETSCYGITKNPLDESRVPGGSSGGSAAAVAAGMVPYALGSDTGGSIRQPASYCGVVGLKPTYGAVSRNGLIAMASSLDVIGPITNSVEDAETVFNEINEYDELDNTSVPLDVRATYQSHNTNKKVIGVPRSFIDREGLDPEVRDNFNASLEKMKDAGYTIVDVDLPHLQYSLAVYYILQPAEASSNLARYDGIRFGLSEKGTDLIDGYKKTKTKGFGKEVQRRIMLGTYVLSSGYHDEYYYKACALRAKITQEITDVFENIDILATPTVPNVAFEFGAKKDPIALYLEDIFTVPYNLTGNPAMSIPSGNNSENMPFGMHFVAPLFCENKLFEVGKDFERAII